MRGYRSAGVAGVRLLIGLLVILNLALLAGVVALLAQGRRMSPAAAVRAERVPAVPPRQRAEDRRAASLPARNRPGALALAGGARPTEAGAGATTPPGAGPAGDLERPPIPSPAPDAARDADHPLYRRMIDVARPTTEQERALLAIWTRHEARRRALDAEALREGGWNRMAWMDLGSAGREFTRAAEEILTPEQVARLREAGPGEAAEAGR